MTWSKLGEGSYNTAYISSDGRSVLKIQKDLSKLTDSPERSVRIWNDINAHVRPPAEKATLEHNKPGGPK